MMKKKLSSKSFGLHPCCCLGINFTRIMTRETPKEAWDKLKEMYMGSERTRQIKNIGLKTRDG